jgi:hypothetical protein
VAGFISEWWPDCVGIRSAAFAGPFEDGFDAYQRHDYHGALQVWRPLADHGDASAQNNLGDLYAKGEGVGQDDAEAVRWYRLAADQGLPSAQVNLGVAYAKGRGVTKDYAETAKWFRKSADQGLAAAHDWLGVAYAAGKGVPKDDDAAVKLWLLAAGKGLADGQGNLGVAYANGEGVARDYIRAYMWYSLAASQGNEHASALRKWVATRMTAGQIAEAQRLAREWKPMSDQKATTSPPERSIIRQKDGISPLN